ncbi:MAG TPA: undecaprenyl-diphosphate phosphatase [Candidatus Saccharibacteria bacterium]|nr:undecaprenyl-diphosphate phosphatase [Candidatus Saccharibacteria bacterium]
MEWWHAVIIGIVEGITEFLPISSTAHIGFFTSMFGYSSTEASVVAFSAIIQAGAIAAAVIYFWKDISRTALAFFKGLFNKSERKNFDYKFGWLILIGSLPIVITGVFLQDFVETAVRSLWWMVAGLLGFTFVLWWADRMGTRRRKEKSMTTKDSIIIGLIQALSLIPGVSRSGAATAAGLLQGFDRVTTTRLAFFLGIPALVGAAVLQIAAHYDEIGAGVGWTATIIGTVVSFIVAFVCIDWLLKFVSRRSFAVFIWYRFALGALLVVLLLTGVITTA